MDHKQRSEPYFHVNCLGLLRPRRLVFYQSVVPIYICENHQDEEEERDVSKNKLLDVYAAELDNELDRDLGNF